MAFIISLPTILICIFSISQVSDAKINDAFLQFLERSNYDHRQLPDENNALNVTVSVYLSDIQAVSVANMDFLIDLYLTETWKDPRLVFDPKQLGLGNKTIFTLDESHIAEIWHPDTFIPNALSSTNPTLGSITHKSSARLDRDGRVRYSRRLSFILKCPMDLQRFPYDMQKCRFRFESYRYSADQVNYTWPKYNTPLQGGAGFNVPEYHLTSLSSSQTTAQTASGNYTTLSVCFVFRRNAGFYISQIAFPTVAILFISWLALWIDQDIGIQEILTIILALIVLHLTYNSSMPHVSYLKAMDLFLVFCLLIAFIFFAVLTSMKHIRRKIEERRLEAALSQSYDNENVGSNPQRPLIAKRSNLKKNGKLDKVYTENFLNKFRLIAQIVTIILLLAAVIYFFIIYPGSGPDGGYKC